MVVKFYTIKNNNWGLKIYSTNYIFRDICIRNLHLQQLCVLEIITRAVIKAIIHPYFPQLSTMKKKSNTLMLMSIKHSLFSGKHELGPTQYVEVIPKSSDVSFRGTPNKFAHF